MAKFPYKKASIYKKLQRQICVSASLCKCTQIIMLMQTAPICNFWFSCKQVTRMKERGGLKAGFPLTWLRAQICARRPSKRLARPFHEMQGSFGSLGPGMRSCLGAGAAQGRRSRAPSATWCRARPRHRTATAAGLSRACARPAPPAGTGLKTPRFTPDLRSS